MAVNISKPAINKCQQPSEVPAFQSVLGNLFCRSALLPFNGGGGFVVISHNTIDAFTSPTILEDIFAKIS